MKWFLVSMAICLVAVSAAPDDLIKLMKENEVTQTVGQTDAATPTETDPDPRKTVIEGSAAERTRLLKNLLADYDKRVNPDKTIVNLTLILKDFEVVENKKTLESNIQLRQEWVDNRFKWNPEEYDGTTLIRLDSNEVWKPDVTLYNSMDYRYRHNMNCWNSNVFIFSTGLVLWVPPCKVSSMCDFDLNVHPYGEQTCSFKFGSWTFDGHTVDLGLKKKTTTIFMKYLSNTSGFKILSTIAERNEGHYDCCAEPYPDVTFNMTIQRIPGEELVKKNL